MGGCDDNPARLIDYEELKKVEIRLVMEIGETAEYFPGALTELILTQDSSMLVSDLKKITIEQFNKEGEHVATIAKQGRGPGELSDFLSLFYAKNDTLIVRRHGISPQVDYFSPDTSNIYRFIKSWIPEKGNERFVNVAGNRSDSTFYARAKWNFKNLQQRRADQGGYSWTPLVIMDKFDNILQDSLHMLKTPTPLTEQTESGGMIIYGIPPYQYRDRFRLLRDGRYLIARPDSSMLYIYDRSHNLDRSIQLRVKDRAVEEADLDYWFEAMRVAKGERKKMEKRVPNYKPPYLNIWVSQNYFWLYADERKEGRKMVVIDREGEPVGTFFLTKFDDIQHIGNERIYTLYKNPTTGHSIRIYKVDL